MEIKNLNKEDLLSLRNDIDSQLKNIEQNEELEQYKNSLNGKNTLRDLKKGDKIYCIQFNGSKVYNKDYVSIEFYKKNDPSYLNLTNFSITHDIIGASSCINDICMCVFTIL